MASLSVFMLKLKPSMDEFFRTPNKHNLNVLQKELNAFEFMDMKVFHVQVLLPLVMNLEKLNGKNQDLRTGLIDCISTVASRLYLQDTIALRSILVVVLSQIRDLDKATLKSNLSEELKLAAVRCFSRVLQHSTTDVLEKFYTKDSVMLFGQILLALVEFIEREKYRTLVIESMQCLMVMFYVHDSADQLDIVLRNQVADMLFIYLPKILTVLIKTSLSDDKLGETLKTTAIKALGRILCIIYNETDATVITKTFDLSDFQKLVEESLNKANNEHVHEIPKDVDKKHDNIQGRLQRLHGNGRSTAWYSETSCRLREHLAPTSILRAHTSARIRAEYAYMCCTLLIRCARHLTHNVPHLLESVVALSEDEDLPEVREECKKCLRQLECDTQIAILDQYCDCLFDEFLMRMPRIIKSGTDAEQYAALTFLKGFMRNLSGKRLLLLFSLSKRLDMFCNCLTAMAELQVTRNLLQEEYSLRTLCTDIEANFVTCCKLNWRSFQNLSSTRSINALIELCRLLGSIPETNVIIFEHLLAKLQEKHAAMIEIMLILQFLTNANKELNEKLLAELLEDNHWNLQLYPDLEYRIKVEKPSQWFMDSTPGLYESAIEVRMQDYDSDDEYDVQQEEQQHVSVADAQYNVLYVCIMLDTIANCAQNCGHEFERYLFRCLHRVLLKIASSNTFVHQASFYALIKIQHALGCPKISTFIESHVDYIAYHINSLLRRVPESHAAVDILCVLLQFSAPKSLPHLSNIFQTIIEACSKSQHTDNINAYLRVFNAFLKQISRWEIEMHQGYQHDNAVEKGDTSKELLNTWLSALADTPLPTEDISPETLAANNDTPQVQDNATTEDNVADVENLPHHIALVKLILQQALKFVSSSVQVHQILALECLIVGLPLLFNYEDELLPLVHLIWQPLTEKFRQRDAIVLQRCFELFNTLATHAKDFLLKRSLNTVIPYLKNFLKEAAHHSATEHSPIKSQEYKLQLKLLSDFANLIISMDIEAKPLYDITETIALYLSNKQPIELQEKTVQFFLDLRRHNCPLVYAEILKHEQMPYFQKNFDKLMDKFNNRR